MTEPEVVATDAIFRRQGVPYVVIGGQAIAQKAATTTHDVDVMVATADFGKTVSRLRGDHDLTFDWEDDRLARFRIRSLGGVPLDIINASTFSGAKSGEEFFGFLAQQASSESDGIRYAAPEAVWYTRLLTKRWKAYAEKIVTNVIDGLPSARLQEVEEIARRFGNEGLIQERVAYVRGELARPDIESLIPRE